MKLFTTNTIPNNISMYATEYELSTVDFWPCYLKPYKKISQINDTLLV